MQDYVDLLKRHRENDADVTIATHSVGWGQASRRGLTRVDPETGACSADIMLHSALFANTTSCSMSHERYQDWRAHADTLRVKRKRAL